MYWTFAIQLTLFSESTWSEVFCGVFEINLKTLFSSVEKMKKQLFFVLFRFSTYFERVLWRKKSTRDFNYSFGLPFFSLKLWTDWKNIWVSIEVFKCEKRFHLPLIFFFCAIGGKELLKNNLPKQTKKYLSQRTCAKSEISLLRHFLKNFRKLFETILFFKANVLVELSDK